MLQWATTYLRKVWNKLLGLVVGKAHPQVGSAHLVGLSSTSEPTTGKRPRSVSDGFESYVLPTKPIRIRAVPGDLTQRWGPGAPPRANGRADRLSCPELRRRTRGLAKTQWDPSGGLRPSRNVIHEDEMEDERKARASLMQMYR